jgi:hypothetical protein
MLVFDMKLMRASYQAVFQRTGVARLQDIGGVQFGFYSGSCVG